MSKTDGQPETADLERLLDSLLREEHVAFRAPVESAPQFIGRYRIHQAVGQGGFGVVYLAYDEELARPVAIKTPHRERFVSAGDLDEFLEEARVAARLDHPSIVPVYDIGKTSDGRGYVVSKWLAGGNLRELISSGRPKFTTTAEFIAVIADALAHTHSKGLIHRDIKPANILLDREGRTYLTDFGLALHEDRLTPAGKHAGTPAYMSPEQVRQEGHRIDGRSDVFSLGVVMYQLLTNQLPFTGESVEEVLKQITRCDPRPVRGIDPGIPTELERICQNAMAKQVLDRYGSAAEFRDELLRYLAQAGPSGSRSHLDSRLVRSTGASVSGHGRISAVGSLHKVGEPDGAVHSLALAPRGLRAFGQEDADFFLTLLPGPKDHNGLAAGARFWKQGLESLDATKAFPVGVMYGPSGCGKTSLMRAGILPRLKGSVIPLYVESAAEGTERKLLAALRNAIPILDGEESLSKAVAKVRRTQSGAQSGKVIMIIDQFEQWLHAHPHRDVDDELSQALRQCDGVNAQAVLMVRDDFWLSICRFMREIEVRLVEGENCSLVDLFDLEHARRVLIEFGKAYGKLPSVTADMTRSQKRFVEEAVESIAEEGKVVCVRLSLFADLVKDKPWEQATLRAYGGMQGVGEAFLEEALGENAVNMRSKVHSAAARRVLAALAPEGDADIKGFRISSRALAEASGYARRPEDFSDLMRLLDGELRLITPVAAEPESQNEEENYYQLTHDYLVPVLRSWLTSKKRETWRGRAEILLNEYHRAWKPMAKAKLLPGLAAYLTIRMGTSPQSWSKSQERMMREAGRKHLQRTAIASLVLMGLFALGGYGYHEVRNGQAQDMAKLLLRAKDENVRELLDDVDRRGLTTLVANALRREQPHLKDEGMLAMALLGQLRQDASVAPQLAPLMLSTSSDQSFFALLDELLGRGDQVSAIFWRILENPAESALKRYRSGVALASLAPDDVRWPAAADQVASWFVTLPLENRDYWIDRLRPVKVHLVPSLKRTIESATHSVDEQTAAARALAEFYAGETKSLVDCLRNVEPPALAPFVLSLKQSPDAAIAEVTQLLLNRSSQPHKPTYGEARAVVNALAALFRLGVREPWLRGLEYEHANIRNLMEVECLELGLDLNQLGQSLLKGEATGSRKTALIRSLAHVSLDSVSESLQSSIVAMLVKELPHAREANLRSSIVALLRKWDPKHPNYLALALDDEELATVADSRDATDPVNAWYRDRWMGGAVAISGNQTFRVGSPQDEATRDDDELLGSFQLDYRFAIAATEVTLEQFERFRKLTDEHDRYAERPDGPQINVSWELAAQYCNWLSQQAGLAESEWCFIAANTDTGNTAREAPEPRLPQWMPAPNYLQRRGYRLPTEYEWELAARGGENSARYCGDFDRVLSAHGWYEENAEGRTHHVGSLLPNPLGLFDVYGNVSEWCVCYPPRRTGDSSATGGGAIGSGASGSDANGRAPGGDVTLISVALPFPATLPELVLKGGAFTNDPSNVRSAERQVEPFYVSGPQSGFRIVKTIGPRFSGEKKRDATVTGPSAGGDQ